MTNKQVSWVLFVFAMTVSFIFLSVLIRVNYDLDTSQRRIDSLQRQIDEIKKTDTATHDAITAINKTTTQLSKELDATQELQRKQAMAVGDLKKGKKK
jgi:low affinity Fe/Cu permease